MLLRKRIKMQGFIVFDDYGPRWSEFAGEMGSWVQAGLLQGKNFGKPVIQVAHE